MKLARTFGLVLCVSIVGGCDSEQHRSGTEAREQPNVATPQKEDAFKIPDNLVSSILESDRPTSIDSFKTEFVRRFENDMYSPFVELAFWGNSDNDSKKKYLEGVKATFTMPTLSERATIRSPADIEMKTVADYGDYAYFPSEGDDEIQLAPPATHVMGVTGHLGENTTVTNYFAVGEKAGKFYFCTIASK
jgi:hypothetical protein